MDQDQVRDLLCLWRQAHDEAGSSEEDARARDRFTNLLRRRGWKWRGGGIKTAMCRGDLIVKYAYAKGDDLWTEREWRIWKRAPVFKRRFLARCYAYENGLLIQQFHPEECRRNNECGIAEQYAVRFRICDWAFNHSHRPSGLPVFFDYDNKGSGWAAWRQRLLKRRAA